MSLTPAQVAAGASTIQDIIDGLFTLGRTGDPDVAMAIALAQGMHIGIANPELAGVLSGSVDVLLGNPSAPADGQSNIVGIVGGMYDEYLGRAEKFVASDPRITALAAEAQAELEARGRD